MYIKSFINKGVLKEIISDFPQDITTAENIKLASSYYKLIEFIKDCDDYTILGDDWLDQEGPISDYLIRTLGQKGTRTGHIEDSLAFDDLVKNTLPFSLQFTKNKLHSNGTIPTLTITETISLIRKSSQKSFSLTEKNNRTFEFTKANHIHSPQNILISDRHFFTSPNPYLVLSRLLLNFFTKKSSASVTITFLYHDDPKFGYKIEKIQEELKIKLKENFPNVNFELEIIKIEYIKETHDRFLVTDILCYSSGNSFTFLDPSSYIVTKINRTMLIDSKNFRDEMKHVNAVLASVKRYPEIQQSKNQIIKAFL